MPAIKHTAMREDFSITNTRTYSAARTDVTIQMALDSIGGLYRQLLLADEDDGVWTLTNDVTIPANVVLHIPLGVTLVGPGDLLIEGGLVGLRAPAHLGPGGILWDDSVVGLVSSHATVGALTVGKLVVQENLTVQGRLTVGTIGLSAPPGITYDAQQEVGMQITATPVDAWRLGLRVATLVTMTGDSPNHLISINPLCTLDPRGFLHTGGVAAIGADSGITGTLGGTVDHAIGVYGLVFNHSTAATLTTAYCVVAQEVPAPATNGPITNYHGMYVADTIRGTSRTYGLSSWMALRTVGLSYAWNLFMGGSAPNYLQAGLAIATADNKPGAHMLNVNGTAAKPGGGSWADSSTRRFKTNIQPLTDALPRLLALQGRTFEWVEPEHARLLPGTQMGLVAEEVEPHFPQWVGSTPAVRPVQMTPPSTDAAGHIVGATVESLPAPFGDEPVKTLQIIGFEALVIEALRELDTRLHTIEEPKDNDGYGHRA